MKRTTVFVDEDVLRKLREIAKRENSSVAEVTRKAWSNTFRVVERNDHVCRWLELVVVGGKMSQNVLRSYAAKGLADNAPDTRRHWAALCDV